MNSNRSATSASWTTLPDDIRVYIVSMLTLKDAYSAYEASPDEVQSAAFRKRIQNLQPLRDAWVRAEQSILPSYANPPYLATQTARLSITPLDFSLLETLPLRKSNLETLPSSIQELTELRTLDASYNRLTHLPPALAQCTKIRIMNLTFNQLEHFPRALCHLQRLCTLLLSNNPIKSLPSECWTGLPFLYRLGLFDCDLSAPLPDQLCEWLATPTRHNRHRSANLQKNNFHTAQIAYLLSRFPQLINSILM